MLKTTNLTVYTLAFSVRSGSNFLGELLTANGLARPSEYFQHPFGSANKYWYELLNVPTDNFPLFLETLLTRQSENAIFGMKLSWDHKNALIAEVQKYFPKVHDLNDIFPNNKLIHITRRDKISQAISLWRAMQTNQWSSIDNQDSVSELSYDVRQLLFHLKNLLVEDYLWNHYFEMHQLAVKQIVYEDLIAQPRETICEIDRYIRGTNSSLSPNAVIMNNRLQIQRDDQSIQIKQRFLDDLYYIGVDAYQATRQTNA